LKEVVALAAASLFHPGQMFLPLLLRDPSGDMGERCDALLFSGEALGT
jgi:hypothetical protein